MSSAPLAGDIVTLLFIGQQATKRRPAVVLSSNAYHEHRPDIIVGLLTTQIEKANAPTDCIIEQWQRAGLNRPSAFRLNVITVPANAVTKIGTLSELDCQAVRKCVRIGIGLL